MIRSNSKGNLGAAGQTSVYSMGLAQKSTITMQSPVRSSSSQNGSGGQSLSQIVENPMKTNQFEAAASEKSIGQNSISVPMSQMNLNKEIKNEINFESKPTTGGQNIGFQPVSKYTKQLMEQYNSGTAVAPTDFNNGAKFDSASFSANLNNAAAGGQFKVQLGMSLKDTLSQQSNYEDVPKSHHSSVMSSAFSRQNEDLLSQSSGTPSQIHSNFDSISVSKVSISTVNQKTGQLPKQMVFNPGN